MTLRLNKKHNKKHSFLNECFLRYREKMDIIKFKFKFYGKVLFRFIQLLLLRFYL